MKRTNGKPKKELDLNILKKPRFYIPTFIVFVVLLGLGTLVIWKPGIARGEYNLPTIINMLTGSTPNNNVTKKPVVNSTNGEIQTPTPTSAQSTSTAGSSATAKSGTDSNNDSQPTQGSAPIVTTPIPTPVSASTCSETQKSAYLTLYNNAVATENTRYTDQVNTINNNAAASGTYNSGIRTAAITAADSQRQTNLSSLEATYTLNLASVNCSK